MKSERIIRRVRRKIILEKVIVICLTVCLLAAVIVCPLDFFLPRYKVLVTGNEVNNDYNNLLAGGGLVRKGRSLYYSYWHDKFTYALVKINMLGPRTLFMQPCEMRDERMAWYTLFIKHKGNVIVSIEGEPDTGEWLLNTTTNTFSRYEALQDIPGFNYYYQETENYFAYSRLVKEEHELYERRELNVISSTGENTLVAEDVISFYLHDNVVYYLVSLNEKSTIWKYDLSSGMSCAFCDLEGSANYFIIESDYIVYDNTESVYLVSLEDASSRRVLEVDRDNFIFRINAYESKLFVGTSDYIASYDINSNETKILYGKDSNWFRCGLVGNVYILDDTWIYFEGENSTLWRITQDGRYLQKIYGW